MSQQQLISDILTVGKYPCITPDDLKNSQIRDAIIQRFNTSLESRPVVNSPGNNVCMGFFVQGDQVMVKQARFDMGWMIWTTSVPENLLYQGKAWDDVRYNELHQIPVLKEDPHKERIICNVRPGPNTR